jgi:hypothetical protein
VSRLRDLPTVDEMAAERAGKPLPKGRSRLEATADARTLTIVDEKAFRKAVIERDGYICRMCQRKVLQTMARVPERLEVHHVHGRRGDLRFEPRAAIVTCCQDHERLTGRVNEKWAIVATKTFTLNGHEYTDCRFPIVFKRIA